MLMLELQGGKCCPEVFDFYFQPYYSCIVMEKFEFDLRAFLKRTGKCMPLFANQLVGDIAEALSYVHSHHIIHRDLHSKNVLIRFAGAFEHKPSDCGKLTSCRTIKRVECFRLGLPAS